MTSFRSILLPVFMLVAVLAVPLFEPAAAQAELIERVIASVNNDVITLSDLRQAVAFNREASGGKKTGEENGRSLARETLDGLINRKLLLQEAARLRFVDVSDQEVSAELDRVRRGIGSDAAYRVFLSRSAMTEEELKEMLREQLLVQRFVQRKIDLYARVSHDDAEAYYNDHRSEYANRSFADVQKQITSLLSGQLAAQQLDSYVAELRSRAMIHINPLQGGDGF
jgi:peptidyl-prolyl cis-trans isomerase SurA